MSKYPRSHEGRKDDDPAATAQRTLSLLKNGFSLLEDAELGHLGYDVQKNVSDIYDSGVLAISALSDAISQGHLGVAPWRNPHDEDAALRDQVVNTGAAIPNLLVYLSHEVNADESNVRTDLRWYRVGEGPEPVLLHLSYDMYLEPGGPRLNFTAAYNDMPGTEHMYADGSSSPSHDDTVITVNKGQESKIGFGQRAEDTPSANDLAELVSVAEDLRRLAVLSGQSSTR